MKEERFEIRRKERNNEVKFYVVDTLGEVETTTHESWDSANDTVKYLKVAHKAE